MKEFQKELRDLINCHSLESGSNTPDFLLAEYLTDCLKTFNKAHTRRMSWCGDKEDKRQITAGGTGD